MQAYKEQARKISFAEIFVRLGADPGRRGRTRCPLHGGENPTALSYSDDRGTFYCFACGEKGDKVTLVTKALTVGFKDALRWLGVESDGRQLRVDAEQVRARNLSLGLRVWANSIGRKLRDDLLARERIEFRAVERLRIDPENEMGWRLLEIAYKGKSQIEHLLSLLEATQQDQLAAFRECES